ncbi:MAG: cupin domain-containing protein [Thermoplasmata archaeon]
MGKAEQKAFGAPDEVLQFEKAKVEIVKIGNGVVHRAKLEPGWYWSKHFKPMVKTEWCEAPHFQYLISGRMHIKMADGTEFDAGPGEVMFLPPGHDAWVVGNEPALVIDWIGVTNHAKG